jgi:predicted PurR-regulated permease PerM
VRTSEHPRLLTLVGVGLVTAGLWFAKDVLVPFAIAFLFAFLLGPFLSRVQRIGLSRAPAVMVVMACALVVAGVLAWLVVGEVNSLVDKLPEYQENLKTRVASVRATIGKPIEKATSAVAEITRDGAQSKPVDAIAVRDVTATPAPGFGLESVLKPLGQAVWLLGSVGLVLLLVAVMLFQKEDLRDRLIRLVGRTNLYATTRALDEASAKVSRYLLSTSLVNGSLAVCVGAGLFLIGVPNAFLFGLLFGILRFIPYIGAPLGAALPVILAFAIAPGWDMPLMTIGLFVVLDLVTANVIEPWLYGGRTGISPGALILAAVFWTWIWGTAGLFLSTPLTVCLAVLGKHVPPLRFLHVLLGNEPVLSTPAKLYQRLLAKDRDEAWTLIEKEVKESPDVRVFDEILIPALVLAENDRHEGTLDDAAYQAITQVIFDLVEDVEEQAEPTAVDKRVVALCAPAEDEGDHVVAVMADRLLRRIGFETEVVPTGILTGQLVTIARERGAQVVLLSNLPPSGFVQLRYACKRLAQIEGLVVLVGVWGTERDVERARERLPRGSFHVVRTLAEAAAEAGRLLQSPQVESSSERSSDVAVRPPAAAV